MKCIAHRGYSLKYKDNSVQAIKEALFRGYDGVEIDIQLCDTGDIVVFHDTYIDNHFLSDMTAEQLKQKDIHTLREIYDEIPEIKDVPLFLDLKGNNTKLVNALIDFYKKEPVENVTFCSFNRNLIYNLPIHFNKGSTFETTFIDDEFDTLTRNLSCVLLHWTCLDHHFIAYCRSNKIKVYTYTHKEDMELTHMYKYNVDGIITNGF